MFLLFSLLCVWLPRLTPASAIRRLQPGTAFFKAMLLRALRLNNWHAEREASLRLLSAWSELVCVAATDRCAASLKLALQAPGAFARTLVGVLSSAVTHLPESDDKRANDRWNPEHP